MGGDGKKGKGAPKGIGKGKTKDKAHGKGKQWSPAEQESKPKPTKWLYKPPNGVKMHVRDKASIESGRTDSFLMPNEAFYVSEEIAGPGGVKFLRLADGRGFVFDRKEGVGELCVRAPDEEASRTAGSAVGSRRPQSPPPRGDGPAAKRARGPAIHVSASGDGGDVQGLEVLLGRYEQCGRESAGQPVYEKVQGGEGACFLYCWEGDESERGWWFGDEVGGAMVYCYARAKGFPPPLNGWHIPVDGDPEIPCLQVKTLTSPAGSTQAGSGQPQPPQQRPPMAGRPAAGTPNAGAPAGAPAAVPPRPQFAATGGAAAVRGPGMPQNRPPAGMQQRPPMAGGQFRPPGAGATGPAAAQATSPSWQQEDVLYYNFTDKDIGHSQKLGLQLQQGTWPPTIDQVDQGSPAHMKGIPPQSSIVRVNGHWLSTADATNVRGQVLNDISNKRPLAIGVRPLARVAGPAATAPVPPPPQQQTRPPKGGPKGAAGPKGATSPKGGEVAPAGALSQAAGPQKHVRPSFGPTGQEAPQQPAKGGQAQPAPAQPASAPAQGRREAGGKPAGKGGGDAAAGQAPKGGSRADSRLEVLTSSLPAEERAALLKIVAKVHEEINKGGRVRPMRAAMLEIAAMGDDS